MTKWYRNKTFQRILGLAAIGLLAATVKGLTQWLHNEPINDE